MQIQEQAQCGYQNVSLSKKTERDNCVDQRRGNSHSHQNGHRLLFRCPTNLLCSAVNVSTIHMLCMYYNFKERT